ncbi:MAG: FecR domain-containing protein [Anaerolineaceae bacterium]|nr:FecR domain-containing protein [Anaerolineaceae bacterium]
MESEDLLAHKLTQLEMGYPLDEIEADLPEQEARLLNLAASLQKTAFPVEDDSAVALQRAQLLSAAEQLYPPAKTVTPAKPTSLVGRVERFLIWLGTQVDGLLRRRDVAYGLGAALVIGLLVGGVWLYQQQNSPTPRADRDEPDRVAETDAADGPEEVPDVAGGQAVGSATAVPPPTPPTTDTTATDTTSPSYELFLPLAEFPLQLNAQTAVLQMVQGVAEVQTADGSWQLLPRQTTLTAGQRLRTGDLSSATLTFFDGSQATLSANSELSIDQLNAQPPEVGFRTVVLTQHVGESEHSVQFRSDGGSVYEVNTPAGSGVARGTQFQVVVTPGLLARFAVTEGRVDVSGLNQVVAVVAGQTTAVLAGSPPQAPAFRISGEGQVSQVGPVWIIGGQSFQTNSQTLIVGNAQVGDLVRLEGRLLDDGSRMADRIILLRRAVTNRFTLTGQVDAITPTAWTVAGQMVLVDEQTQLDPNIAVGDAVQVTGLIVAGGGLRAEQIEARNSQAGQPFRFTGLVEAQGVGSWTISGVAVAVDDDTRQDEDVAVGDLVRVDGRISPNGTWRAEQIRQLADDDDDDLPSFSFTGQVHSIDPWRVAGIGFETREWTAVAPGVAIGERVRVRGVILNDGTWVAASIDPFSRLGDDDDDDEDDDDENNTIIFVGVVSSIDPWVVNGLPLLLTNNAVVLGNVGVGDQVWVRLRLAGDGTWQVVGIRPLTPRFGLGCFVINTIVLGRQANQLTLQHWPTLTLDDDDDFDDDLNDLEIDSVVTFPLCIAFDGTIVLTGRIIVIYQPIIIVVPTAPQPPGGNNNGNNNGGGRGNSNNNG